MYVLHCSPLNFFSLVWLCPDAIISVPNVHVSIRNDRQRNRSVIRWMLCSMLMLSMFWCGKYSDTTSNAVPQRWGQGMKGIPDPAAGLTQLWRQWDQYNVSTDPFKQPSIHWNRHGAQPNNDLNGQRAVVISADTRRYTPHRRNSVARSAQASYHFCCNL
jgi:hypothetical protein